MSKYPKVKFGDFVEHIVREVELEADKEYPSVGVKWYGEGVHVHEVKNGGSFNASRFEIKANDIIYNDMWARKGSVAIVPATFDGAVASSHFPTFLPDLSRVLPAYLQFYFKTPSFWDDCENASRGSTGRNQIKKSTFYAIEIPLPSLEKQQQIVTKIEAIATKIKKAEYLRSVAIDEMESLSLSTRNKIFEDNPNVPIKKISDISVVVRGSSPRPKGDIRYYGGNIPRLLIADISRDGKYVTPKIDSLTEDGAQLSRPMPKGSLVIAISGSYGVPAFLAVDACIHDGFIGFRDIDSSIDPEYLYQVLLLSRPYFDSVVKDSGLKNLTTDHLKNLDVPVPPLDEQRRIVAYLDGLQAKVNALRELQSQSQEELDALLPSVLDRAFKGEL